MQADTQSVIQVPKAAVDLAKRFEGFHRVPKHDPARAYPYLCPAGYWTIGWGHLCSKDHPPIDQAQAEIYLEADLRIALNATLKFCPVLVTEPEARLAVIVDFTFNLGVGRLQTSTLRRRINQRDWSHGVRLKPLGCSTPHEPEIQLNQIPGCNSTCTSRDLPA